MIFTHINTGSAPNDGTGDTPRAAAQKINSGFDEVEARLNDQGEQLAYAKGSIDDVVALAQESAEAAAADRQQTGEDRDAIASAASATAADRVQTGLDRTAVHADAVAAASDRAVAAAAATTATDKAAIATTKATEASSHKDAAYTYAQSAASAVAYQNLAAIAASKALTAIDLFIYDTSRDSDGGAWRKRCQHTSWYNEPLNTAIRGARREFPAVAIIALEATKLTIYDADDPALPMWMVFDATSTTAPQIWRAARSATCVAAVNGLIAFGISLGGVDSSSGLIEINLIADRMTRTNSDSFYGYERVAGRNTGTLLSVINTPRFLVSTSVSDVAMTVLPDAPIDPATGLPIPTIAVATNGGVSVINDSGVIFSDSANASRNVRFDPDGVLFWVSDNYNLQSRYATPAAYRNGAGVGTWWGVGASANYSTTFPLIGGGSVTNQLTATGRRALAAGGATASADTKQGLAHYLLNTTAIGRSMAALITATYCTGWMVGDTRGAWLASKDTASMSGAELVSNGDFSGGSTGWTTAGGWSISGGAATHAIGTTDVLAQSIGLVAGSTYKVTYTLSAVSGSASVQPRLSGGTQVNGASRSANGTYTEYLTAVAGNTQLIFVANSAFGCTIDDVSVKLVSADRSVKNKGLTVNGTITRAAVALGAELVGFGGFDSPNYLEQPYNADLDFGTGDFAIMAWGTAAAFAGTQNIADRGNGSDSTGRLQFGTSAGALFVSIAGSAITAANALTPGVWSHLCATRTGGTVRLYVNGEQVATGTAAGSVTGSFPLRVGIGQAITGRWPGSLALLRIGATAPSADQIRKIYEDEKALFVEGAACTLYGTSDAVTALAHDRDTGMLHVGTSAGRSVFQGLRRVANTTNAVGAAISAATGIVVDD